MYSSQVNSDLRLTINHAIKSAKKSLYLYVYSLSDTKIITSINQKAREGLKIIIVCDKNTCFYLSKQLDPRIQFKRQEGIKGLMHKKILVIDHHTVFIGSTNFTYPSLEMHNNLIIGFYHPELAEKIESGIFSSPFDFSVDSKKCTLYFLPQHSMALESLITGIQSAHSSLSIAIFTWTHPLLLEEVIRAKKRGVDVRIVLDGYCARGAGKKVYKALTEQNIQVHLPQQEELMHHKYVLIDKQILFFGSTNWTQSAFTKNEECLVRMEISNKKEQAFLSALWNDFHKK